MRASIMASSKLSGKSETGFAFGIPSRHIASAIVPFVQSCWMAMTAEDAASVASSASC